MDGEPLIDRDLDGDTLHDKVLLMEGLTVTDEETVVECVPLRVVLPLLLPLGEALALDDGEMLLDEVVLND